MLVLSCSTSVVVVAEDDVAVAEAEHVVAEVDEDDGEEAAMVLALFLDAIFSSCAFFLMCVRQ
jgi:hypothetical protein